MLEVSGTLFFFVKFANQFSRKVDFQLGKEMVDYIADYLENIRNRRVYPDVKPGYIFDLIPHSAPLNAEPWEEVFGDVEKYIMPGVSRRKFFNRSLFDIKHKYCLILGHSLAISAHARVFSSVKLVPFPLGGYVSRRDQLFGIYMGNTRVHKL